MTTYIYLVKCPNCEDEYFDFFKDAEAFALGKLSEKPIITQTEVERNDFGECTDHCDLGTVWSWEDVIGKETDAEPTISVFTKDDLKLMADGKDPEFEDEDDDFCLITEDLLNGLRISSKSEADRKEIFKLCHELGIFTGADLKTFMKSQEATDANLLDKLRAYKDGLGPNFKLKDSERKPIPEDMTIEELVEAMEENEDTVECTKCGGLFEKAECTHNKEGFGWCCTNCESENTLVEEAQEEYDLATLVKDSINHLTNNLGKDPWAEDFTDEVIADLENNYGLDIPEHIAKYNDWASSVACEVSRQLNNQLGEDLDPEEPRDLGNEYDGGYPAEGDKLAELEDADEYSKRLIICPECGEKSYDAETSFCISCGFN